MIPRILMIPWLLMNGFWRFCNLTSLWLTVIRFGAAGFIVKLGRNILGLTLWGDIYSYCSSWSCLCSLTFYQIYVQYLSYQHILWTVPLNVTAIDCHRCIFLQFHWKQTKFKHNTKKYNYIIWSDIITSSTSVEDNLIPILTVPDFLHCDLHGSNIKNPRR